MTSQEHAGWSLTIAWSVFKDVCMRVLFSLSTVSMSWGLQSELCRVTVSKSEPGVLTRGSDGSEFRSGTPEAGAVLAERPVLMEHGASQNPLRKQSIPIGP